MSNDRDSIQARLLSNIDDTYDKSNGQFIYDAEKPVAIELESAYVKIDGMLDKRYADTATGKDLDRIVKEVGLSRKLTTQSFGFVTITGVVGAIIAKGEKVASDSINFIFTEDMVIPSSKTINVPVTCEKYGAIGNVPVGAIKYFPKTLEGLQTVVNVQAFSNGYDEENDNSLRERYYTKVKTPSTSGNIYHYKNWALEVTGVGDAKIIPLWDKSNGKDGAGTVKVVIINANKVGADATLISSVAEHIEIERPIGATVTVVSANSKDININASLVIDTDNYTLDTVKTNIEANIIEYLKDIAFNASYVSYAKIGSIILSTNGVLDYSNLLVNTLVSNVPILDEEIATLGIVTLGVI